jgi:hypothetical protein
MAYELILPFQPHIPDLEKHLLTPLRTRRLIPHGESLVPYEPCSLRANTDTVNVPTHRPMSLAELQMLFTRMYDSTALGQHPVLPIQGYTLAEYVKNDVQRRLLALHGRAVAFTPGRVNAQQIYSKRLVHQRLAHPVKGGSLCPALYIVPATSRPEYFP